VQVMQDFKVCKDHKVLLVFRVLWVQQEMQD
jgi:hypothetical protein